MASDIVLFPNCDLHVALNGTPPLTLRVSLRVPSGDNMSYVLHSVPLSSLSFDFFAPYNAVGNRLQKFVNVDPNTGLVTPTAVGTNLVQIRLDDPHLAALGDHYIVARIQVHDRILGWWFGNASMTTAKDSAFAYAQPSIYALFSDDPSGTDLVGDITGHGYVPLTSSDPSVFNVNADGRLQGLKEGDATLSGTFLTVSHTLPVKVVDYGKPRAKLEYVQVPNVEHPETMHNILFISEGFRDTKHDRDKFNKIVTEVVDEMFNKPRHAPYSLLEGSFNIWKAFEPSPQHPGLSPQHPGLPPQHAVTCGYRVNDEEVPGILGKGYPIPYPGRVSSDAGMYTVELLTRIVGLPLRNETRNTAQLKALWGSQSLNNFVPNKVDDKLVAVWKKQKSLGILEARDTFFGLYLGARYGDRWSGLSTPPVLPPASDIQADAKLAPFVKRVYEWFDIKATRLLTPDPRRHPPELHSHNQTNFGNSILKYITGLRVPFAPHPNVGQEWMPDPTGTSFKKSRGLVALISNDGLVGGANFNNLTITSNTLATHQRLAFQYTNSGNERIMRRTPPDSIEENIDDIINTVAHEFGHSFNLDDEYENFPGDRPSQYDGHDNIAVLASINLNANFLVNRKLDTNKVKWFDLLRIQVSDTLIKDSETEGGLIKVSIRKGSIGRWIEAKKQNLKVFLRRIDVTPDGKQLPLLFDNNHYLKELDIIGNLNEANGTILLGGPKLPPAPLPIFPAGSLLFVPKRDSSGQLASVVEKKVLDKLKPTDRPLPLNKDSDTTKVNDWADYPIDIPDFKPPCKSYKLIGIYEGASRYTGMVYRPAGLCKMRKHSDPSDLGEFFTSTEEVGDGEFCHVCKWLIVNRVDPSLHAILDKKYYPEAK
jgi:hypothetical protein